MLGKRGHEHSAPRQRAGFHAHRQLVGSDTDPIKHHSCERLEFKQRVGGLGINGVTLHSYRYAWAERARKCGYPERFAQEAFGHNSNAVHRAYAKHAQVTLPSLEKYEKNASEDRIIPLWQQQGQSTWKQLIRMLLLARGQRDDDKAIVDYQSMQLGSSTGDTCLAELLPLPSPDTATWNYGQSSDLDRVSSRQSYLTKDESVGNE